MPRRRPRKTLRSPASRTGSRASTIERVRVALTLALSHLATSGEELHTALDLLRFAERTLSALHVPAGVAVAEAKLAALRPRKGKKGSPR